MAGPLRHLGDLAQARPLQRPAGLEVEWLGVSVLPAQLRGTDFEIAALPRSDLAGLS